MDFVNLILSSLQGGLVYLLLVHLPLELLDLLGACVHPNVQKVVQGGLKPVVVSQILT